MFSDHSSLRYLVNKPVLAGDGICRWLLLFQEYEFEIIVNIGRMNAWNDHLMRLEARENPLTWMITS